MRDPFAMSASKILVGKPKVQTRPVPAPLAKLLTEAWRKRVKHTASQHQRLRCRLSPSRQDPRIETCDRGRAAGQQSRQGWRHAPVQALNFHRRTPTESRLFEFVSLGLAF